MSYVASPGCLCEQHVVKTIKQIDFTEGKQVKQAYHETFQKYRRMKHTCKYWEQGMLVVNVDANGDHTVLPYRIQETSKGPTAALF